MSLQYWQVSCESLLHDVRTPPPPASYFARFLNYILLFIPNSHFKITHMPSYYNISLRQRNGFTCIDMSE